MGQCLLMTLLDTTDLTQPSHMIHVILVLNHTILMLFLSTIQPSPILSAIEDTIETASSSFSHDDFLQ